MGDAGFDRGIDCAVTGNKGSVEVIEEDYHGFLQARKSGHTQRKPQLLTIGNKRGKENKSEVKGVDESKGEG